mmetsp:Transcript_113845/g.327137  ORF Transcript_113845/g.327137 Transcript_113845/m.327137 type:complete len:250 (+) Transcript_113845:69-818(+)
MPVILTSSDATLVGAMRACSSATWPQRLSSFPRTGARAELPRPRLATSAAPRVVGVPAHKDVSKAEHGAIGSATALPTTLCHKESMSCRSSRWTSSMPRQRRSTSPAKRSSSLRVCLTSSRTAMASAGMPKASFPHSPSMSSVRRWHIDNVSPKLRKAPSNGSKRPASDDKPATSADDMAFTVASTIMPSLPKPDSTSATRSAMPASNTLAISEISTTSKGIACFDGIVSVRPSTCPSCTCSWPANKRA